MDENVASDCDTWLSYLATLKVNVNILQGTSNKTIYTNPMWPACLSYTHFYFEYFDKNANLGMGPAITIAMVTTLAATVG